MPRTLPLSLIAGALMLGSGADALALGFGRSGGQHMLGQPLSFAIPIRLDDDESLGATCASAEVEAGDVRLVPSDVRASIEPGREPNERVLRVVTSRAIDEPIVNVSVSVGCPPRLTRRFVLLLDPPMVQYAAQGEPMALPPVPESTTAAAPSPASRPARTTDATSGSQLPRASAASAASAPRSARRTARATAARSSVAAAPQPAAPASSPARSAARAASTPSAAAAAQPRLRLDPLEPNFAVEAIATAAANAASAAAEAASAASAAAEANARARALEDNISRLRAESKREQDNLAAMRARLSEAEAKQYNNPITYVLAALTALLLLAIFFLWRQRARERDAGWWKDEEQSVAAPRRAGDSTQGTLRTSGFDRPQPEADADLETGPTPFTTSGTPMRMAVTQPAPISPPTIIPPNAVEPKREVTVEELIDLEQQAEFFIVLGQDDAAIDLLMGHLRSTGGISPLPYLKLLEIYRRRNERESYERTRERFNHRFNAYAPDWDSDLNKGASLDDYPEVTEKLQQIWREPSGAMAELESLLFRKAQDQGTTFDLPAYREVLFLYSLARDLQEHEPGGVDLLLPLDDSDDGAMAAEPLTSSATTTMALHGPLEWSTDVPAPTPAPTGDLDIDLDLGIQLDFDEPPKKS